MTRVLCEVEEVNTGLLCEDCEDELIKVSIISHKLVGEHDTYVCCTCASDDLEIKNNAI